MNRQAKALGANLFGWAAPCLPLAGVGLPLAVYLPHYYASVLGLDLGVVGGVFLAVRCIDIAVDPVIGWAMDRTHIRWGRYRTWMTLGTPVLALGVWEVFMAARPAGPMHLLGWLVVLYLGFSITTLAQLAWGAVLAPRYDARSRLYGWWQAGNIAGVLIALFIPVLATRFAGGGEASGVHAMGAAIVFALPVALGLNLWLTPEPRHPEAAPLHDLRAISDLFRRASLRKLVCCDLLLGLAPGLIGALLFFYFGAIKGFSQAQSQTLMVVYFLGGLLAAPFWSWLATRAGKARTLQLASLAFALFTACVGLIPTGAIATAHVVLFVAGLPYAAGLLLTRAMMADVADEVRLDTGEDRTGLLFSLLSLTTKLGFALSVGSLVVLQSVGFQAGGGNGQAALFALQFMFLGAPVLLLAAAALVMRAYPLTAQRHAAIRTALDARDGAA